MRYNSRFIQACYVYIKNFSRTAKRYIKVHTDKACGINYLFKDFQEMHQSSYRKGYAIFKKLFKDCQEIHLREHTGKDIYYSRTFQGFPRDP